MSARVPEQPCGEGLGAWLRGRQERVAQARATELGSAGSHRSTSIAAPLVSPCMDLSIPYVFSIFSKLE